MCTELDYVFILHQKDNTTTLSFLEIVKKNNKFVNTIFLFTSSSYIYLKQTIDKKSNGHSSLNNYGTVTLINIQ